MDHVPIREPRTSDWSESNRYVQNIVGPGPVRDSEIFLGPGPVPRYETFLNDFGRPESE